MAFFIYILPIYYHFHFTMRNNNFDFLRLLFSLLVIITHSYLVTGLPEHDLLYYITKGQLTFSYLGITGFFIISGYLVFQSLERSKSIFDYYRKRILRIFPAYIVLLFVTCILAYFVYSDGITSYINNQSVYSYFFKNLTLYKYQDTINGTLTGNPINYNINVSLWTLKYEFFFYIILSGFFYFKQKSKLILLSILLAILALSKIFFFNSLIEIGYVLNFGQLVKFGTYFWGGALLAAINIRDFKYKSPMILISTTILILSIVLNLYEILSIFALPIFIILIVSHINKIYK